MPLSFLLLALACRPAPPVPPATRDLVRVAPGSEPTAMDDGATVDLVDALDRDLEYLRKRPATAEARVADASCSAADLARALAELRGAALPSPREEDLAEYVRSKFAFYRSTGRRGGALLTGYFEPLVDGRRVAEPGFEYPLYRRPSDLVEIDLGALFPDAPGLTIYGRVAGGELQPYYSRREIDAGRVLAERGIELAWLADPVARYFLQIQGSGIVRLGNGSTMRVGFAGTNGKPYTSIGRLLAADGSLGGEPASAPAIQRYLRAHADRRDELLFRNERYVFFREVPDGPIGKLGVKLTAGRSVAADLSLYPPAALLYLESEMPVLDGDGAPIGSRPFRRLVLAQDAGGAITGPGRLDLFFGTGDEAGLRAGTLDARADMYLLLPRGCAPENR